MFFYNVNLFKKNNVQNYLKAVAWLKREGTLITIVTGNIKNQ